MDWAFGKSALVLPVPCQVNVQPPLWFAMLSALLPATRTLSDLLRGRTPPLFLSRTRDFCTALRAMARCSAEPSCDGSLASFRVDGAPLLFLGPRRPALILTRRIRVTASLIRDTGIALLSTSAIVL